ncbi:ROK family transcriptional regulator [Sphingomonas bacterium]|uniref:ROK family transcriptional regulator n=1 Tax=Sphingomonas bacterium TaxID=1895847 RepID=UPI001574F9F6|nr:ROK family transcriptional regulator [Sphingomonas bacterium]
MSSDVVTASEKSIHCLLPWHDGQIQVLRALHFAQRASRRELSNLTGLSPQSLSRIAQELVTTGYIEELERRRTGGMGQPAIELRITPGRILTIGVVIEHDQIICVLSDLAEGVVQRSVVSGNFQSAEKSAQAAESLIANMIEDLPKDSTLLGIGVSQSGFFFEPAKQRIIGVGDIEGWLKLDLGARLTERFGLEVFIENDGRAAATGHLVHGIGTQFENYFVVLMTRGVGGGGVVNGRLVRGRSGNAGEMPMLVPRRNGIRPSVESLADHMGLNYDDPDFARTVEQALAHDDPLLTEWLTVCAAKLENVLASICAVLDPEAFIFSGRMPFAIRTALGDRIRLSGPSIAGISGPSPSVVIDPAADCLEIGAAALPIARVFSGVSRNRPQS